MDGSSERDGGGFNLIALLRSRVGAAEHGEAAAGGKWSHWEIMERMLAGC